MNAEVIRKKRIDKERLKRGIRRETNRERKRVERSIGRENNETDLWVESGEEEYRNKKKKL